MQGDAALLDRLTGVTSVQTTGLKRAAAQERLRSVGGKRRRRHSQEEQEEAEGETADRHENDPNVIGTEVRRAGTEAVRLITECSGKLAL